MTININENISNVYTEDRKLIRTTTSTMYMIYASEGKVLKNTLTGRIAGTYVGVGSEDKINNYIEIDKE